MSTHRKYRDHDQDLYNRRRAASTRSPSNVGSGHRDKSLGGSQVGKVGVNIRLKTSLSKWGTRKATPQSTPQQCGLLVLQVTSDPNAEYQLQNVRGDLGFEVGTVLDQVQPEGLAGPSDEKQITDEKKFAPEVEASGAKIGGVGGQRTRQYSEKRPEWSFHASSWEDNEGEFRQLRWYLKDQKHGTGAIFHRKISMFAELYFDDPDPTSFGVNVKIEGKLKSRRAELKRRLFCFAPNTPINSKTIKTHFPPSPRPIDRHVPKLIAQVRQMNRDALPEVIEERKDIPD